MIAREVDGRRGDGPRGRAGPAIGVGAVVLVVLLLAGVGLGVVGIDRGGGEGGGGEGGAPPTVPRPETATTERRRVATATTTDGLDEVALGSEVVLRVPGEGDFAAPPSPLDGLAGPTVLRVTATGFLPDSDGRVSLCLDTPAGLSRCRHQFPVRFDDAGTGRFQYLLHDEVAGTRCGPGARCVVAVGGQDGRSALLPVVFGAKSAAPPRVTVRGRHGLDDGEAVAVELEGFAPGARVRVLQCAPPGIPVARFCGAPGPVEDVTVGAGGRAAVEFTVRAGDVGSGRHPCRRGHVCAIAAVADDGALAAAPSRLVFTAGPGAAYDPVRLAAGLVVAALLAATATWLVRTTDWREPTEAATPEMDAAALDPPAVL